MAVTCYERFGSRRTNCDERTYTTSIETKWTVEGATDQDAARAALLATAPPLYSDSILGRVLPRYMHEVEQVGPEQWDCTLVYQSLQSLEGGNQNQPGLVSVSFDTSGKTVHKDHGINETIYPNQALERLPPNQHGAINVHEDGVDGADGFVAPYLKFSETHQLPAALITPSYINILASLTGSVNASAWRIFEPKQVLFLGATGQTQDDGYVSVTFQFEVGRNVTENVCGIDGVYHNAFDYVWVFFDKTVDNAAKRLVESPVAVYVDEVYPSADFSLLGI
jgi:hypothetical protein